MSKSETYGGPERRLERNADLRARLTEVASKISDHHKLTEEDLRQLYLLMRDHYQRGLASSSIDMLQIVREGHAQEFSPALLALLDSVMGRRD